MVAQVKPALILLVIFTVLTGILYPLLVTGLAQTFFPRQANGSLVTVGGQVVGSQRIGQQFNDPGYFWGRPSASAGGVYNASASGGSNYSVLNPALLEQVSLRLSVLKMADPQNPLPVPVDLVTASGSGLDPDISVAAAQYQAARVARERGMSVDQVLGLIEQHTRGRMLGILGEQTVNVLELNLALDGIQYMYDR